MAWDRLAWHVSNAFWWLATLELAACCWEQAGGVRGGGAEEVADAVFSDPKSPGAGPQGEQRELTRRV